MIRLIIILTIYIIFIFYTISNPVKISIRLIFLRITIFNSIFLISGIRWFPLIFCLLFIGGILMIFLILSSLIPNEKIKKNKINKNMMLISIIIAILINLNWKIKINEISWTQRKIFLINNLNIATITILILIYFLIFIILNIKEKVSLRIIRCH